MALVAENCDWWPPNWYNEVGLHQIGLSDICGSISLDGLSLKCAQA